MSRVEDVDAAWREAWDVNRRRDRIDRWWRGGGLSWDPMTRLRADLILRIEADLDDPRALIRITTIA